jgi:branched-chain amino acid transport system substrate-binding protein
MRSGRGAFPGYVVRGLREAAEAAGFSVDELPLDSEPPPEPGLLVLAGSFEEELRVIRSRPKARFLAAVAAGVRAFADELGELAEGVLGPSQWEPAPGSEWFLHAFQERLGHVPEYTAAGAYATGLVIEECIRRADSLDDRRLRDAAAGLDFETFYGRFRIDPETGRQLGHAVVLVRWRGRRKLVLG